MGRQSFPHPSCHQPTAHRLSTPISNVSRRTSALQSLFKSRPARSDPRWMRGHVLRCVPVRSCSIASGWPHATGYRTTLTGPRNPACARREPGELHLLSQPAMPITQPTPCTQRHTDGAAPHCRIAAASAQRQTGLWRPPWCFTGQDMAVQTRRSGAARTPLMKGYEMEGEKTQQK